MCADDQMNVEFDNNLAFKYAYLCHEFESVFHSLFSIYAFFSRIHAIRLVRF